MLVVLGMATYLLGSVTLIQISHSTTKGCGQGYVESPSSTIIRWEDTSSGSQTDAEAHQWTQNSHKHILCLGGFSVNGRTFLDHVD